MLNYAEPNFCKIFRDLDLVAVQFAGLSCGGPQLVNHVLHKCVRRIKVPVDQEALAT